MKTLELEYRKNIIKGTIVSAVKTAKKICKLYPKILQVQPKITGINTGMGVWSFDGHGIGIATEEECKDDEIEIEDTAIQDIVSEGAPDWFDFAINKELTEIVKLVDFLTGINDLNCSTWQNGFNENGVIFYHSETSNQSNPFATPNKQYFKSLGYYKQLVKAGVPVVFKDEDLLKV